MNKAFISKGEEALIIDEAGESQEKRPNYENLKEILETEDTIEELEKTKEELQNSIELNKKIIENNKNHTLSLIITIIGSIISVNIMYIRFVGIEIIELLKILNIGLISFGSILFGVIQIEHYLQKSEKKNNLKGEEEKLKFLSEELTKSKQHLKKLKQNKKVTTSEKITYTKLNTKEKLKELRALFENCYNLGYSESDALSQETADKDREFIAECFEEKGVSLKKDIK